jgi:hypothetical protein
MAISWKARSRHDSILYDVQVTLGTGYKVGFTKQRTWDLA